MSADTCEQPTVRIPDAQAERNMRRALAWREREERRQMNAKRNA